MSVILEFLQSDLGKMLIAAILGFVFGGKNPAWVNWILELLKLQKKTPEVQAHVQYDGGEELVGDVIDGELKSAFTLAQHFRDIGDKQGFEAAKTCINAIIDKGYAPTNWKSDSEVKVPISQMVS